MPNIEGNVFIGGNAGLNDTADYNTFVGQQAGEDFITSTTSFETHNSFLGSFAATNMHHGYYNTIVGGLTAPTLDLGDFNTIVGNEAGLHADSVHSNVMVGHRAGIGLTYGTDNTFIGEHSGVSTGIGTVFHRATAIGSGTQVGCDDCIILGDGNDRIAMGTSNPTTLTHNYRLVVQPISPDTNVAYFNGAVYATSYQTISDMAFKTNVQPIQNISALADQLNAHTFDYNPAVAPQLIKPEGMQYGMIAQEVETVFPQLVEQFTAPAKYDANGVLINQEFTYKTVNYPGFVPIIWQMVKDQKAQIDALASQVAACCNTRISNPDGESTGSIELENINTLQLFAADPNPFSESTKVRWEIPGTFNDAMIYFYDNGGTLINSYKITEPAKGELQVFGSKLSSGIYTYTLVVNGKVIDSKNILKTK